VLERRADDTTDRALGWLSRAPSPVFLWVHYQDPHGPYTPPEDFGSRFDVPAPEAEPVLQVAEPGAVRDRIPRYQAIEGLDRASQYEERYVGEIAYADRAIGRLLSALDARRRPLVVLLTADHGESLGERGHYFKHTHTTTPDVAHVPFLLRAPGLAPERRREWVSHVDVAPTLLDLAGLPIPDGMRGIPLARLLRSPAPWPERFVYCDHGTQLSAYAGDGFLRVDGVVGAWQSRPTGEALAGSGARFLWEPDGIGKRAVGSGAARPAGRIPLPEAVREYVANAREMRVLPPPSDEQRERLRALGYVD
jgi:arylsulfatase A-like enzyme